MVNAAEKLIKVARRLKKKNARAQEKGIRRINRKAARDYYESKINDVEWAQIQYVLCHI